MKSKKKVNHFGCKNEKYKNRINGGENKNEGKI